MRYAVAVTACIVLAFSVALVLHPVPGVTETGLARTVQVFADAGWSGSGVFVADDLVLTARHVVQDAQGLWVVLPDGYRFSAAVVAVSDESDLALIWVPTDRQEAVLSLGQPRIGETVIHVGAPLGLWPTVSRGIVSCLDRDVPELGLDLLQVDCPGCGPGSSGGPVFDNGGRLVGIVVGSTAGGGLGMCVPVEQIRGFLGGRR